MKDGYAQTPRRLLWGEVWHEDGRKVSLGARALYPLIDDASRHGERSCTVAYKTFAAALGCGVSSVEGYVRELKTLGVVKAQRRGRKLTNELVLVPVDEWLAPHSDPQPVTGHDPQPRRSDPQPVPGSDPQPATDKLSVNGELEDKDNNSASGKEETQGEGTNSSTEEEEDARAVNAVPLRDERDEGDRQSRGVRIDSDLEPAERRELEEAMAMRMPARPNSVRAPRGVISCDSPKYGAWVEDNVLAFVKAYEPTSKRAVRDGAAGATKAAKDDALQRLEKQGRVKRSTKGLEACPDPSVTPSHAVTEASPEGVTPRHGHTPTLRPEPEVQEPAVVAPAHSPSGDAGDEASSDEWGTPPMGDEDLEAREPEPEPEPEPDGGASPASGCGEPDVTDDADWPPREPVEEPEPSGGGDELREAPERAEEEANAQRSEAPTLEGLRAQGLVDRGVNGVACVNGVEPPADERRAELATPEQQTLLPESSPYNLENEYV